MDNKPIHVNHGGYNIFLHKGDIPMQFVPKKFESVAIDTEAMGLNINADRLCLIQLKFEGSKEVHLVQVQDDIDHKDYTVYSKSISKTFNQSRDTYDLHINLDKRRAKYQNLFNIINNYSILKIFHFARFDVGILQNFFKIHMHNIYCTKIASKLCRNYTNKHSLKELCKVLLNVQLCKHQQSSDWGVDDLDKDQMIYAANDVIHLHEMKRRLDILLAREGKYLIAQSCFDYIPFRSYMDVMGISNNILEHQSD